MSGDVRITFDHWATMPDFYLYGSLYQLEEMVAEIKAGRYKIQVKKEVWEDA